MKRNRLLGVSLAVMALAASACSDSGPKTLSEDDFIDQMEDICRSAKSDIEDVDATDPGFVNDIVDIIQNGLDDLNKLKPPKALANDFGDFVDNLDDQLNEAQDLADAIDDDDQEAAQKASDNLSELSADGDQIAEDIGADRCVGVGGGSDTPTTEVTDSTEPTESTDEPTTETVAPPATEATTPDTPLPIDSTPVTQPPTEMTQPPPDPNATGEALDASQVWAPPAGYEWGALTDLAGIITPSEDPVIGPVLIDYSAGIVNSTTGGPSAIFYITEISTSPWEQDQIDAYFAFSFGSGGTDTTTPLGLPAKIKPNAADGLDGALAWLNGAGIAVIAPAGTDVLSLIDEFYNANVMGG